MILKIALLFSIFSLSMYGSDFFQANYSFKNVSINYLDWSQRTKEKTTQKEFFYLELEAGAGFDWGDIYMFTDIENPTKSYNNTSPNNLRFTFKPVVDIKLYKNLALHIQDYNLKSKDFYVSNLVTGISYNIKTDFGLTIKPFLGSHYQSSTYYSGFNGYMFGWILLYNFELAQQKFLLSGWHECTFKRDTEDGYDDNEGRQGALALWWNFSKSFTLGTQYRYASYELGSHEYQDAIIYSVKYNF